MKTVLAPALCAFFLVFRFGALAQYSQPPVVTGVTAAQQPFPSTDVNISYTISDPVSTSDNVWILVSSDGGNTWTVPATGLFVPGPPQNNATSRLLPGCSAPANCQRHQG